MNSVGLKLYIIRNSLTERVLEKIGCTNITKSKKYYHFSTPMNSKPTSTVCRIESLNVKVYADDLNNIRDIFSLDMAINKLTFSKSISHIHNILGLEYNGFEEVTDTEIEELNTFIPKKENIKLEYYSKNYLSKYYREMVFMDWVREGILPSTSKEFSLGYSRVYNRVVIPHRYYKRKKNGDNYVGLIGRTLDSQYSLLGIPKYFPIIAYPKTQNLYGLYENKKDIKKAGYVNVFEAEKSVLKRHSRMDKTGVSLCCHSISDTQVKILLELNVDIVVAMDSDVPIEEVLAICDKFYGRRNVYYIQDKYGLLGEKESPADKHNRVFEYLWKNKKRYGAEEREMLLNKEWNVKIERWSNTYEW